MTSFGKKILSTFIEVGEEKKEVSAAPGQTGGTAVAAAAARTTTATAGTGTTGGQPDQRFLDYFDKLFSEANIPGPDYYEFARMIAAMQAITDERSRYVAAFAGLQVQGLDKEKLLATAGEYLRVLMADA